MGLPNNVSFILKLFQTLKITWCINCIIDGRKARVSVLVHMGSFKFIQTSASQFDQRFRLTNCINLIGYEIVILADQRGLLL